MARFRVEASTVRSVYLTWVGEAASADEAKWLVANARSWDEFEIEEGELHPDIDIDSVVEIGADDADDRQRAAERERDELRRQLADWGGPRCEAICPNGHEVPHVCLLSRGHDGMHIWTCTVSNLVYELAQAEACVAELRKQLRMAEVQAAVKAADDRPQALEARMGDDS